MTDITTTVTWQDLIAQHDDELADLEDAYAEVRDLATDEYGDDALERPLPDDPSLLADDQTDLYVYQTQADQYDETAKIIQRRQHVLDRLRDEYGDGDFEIKMMTGAEMMEIETALRMSAQEKDVPVTQIQTERYALTVDTATVDAPEGLPREDGSPAPSQAPNGLTRALYDKVERFNQSGAVDFRAEGLGDVSGPGADVSSASQTPTASHSPPSETTDE